MFGTVLNRFAIQAVIGHPLTVYGEGGQPRDIAATVQAAYPGGVTIENLDNPGSSRPWREPTA